MNMKKSAAFIFYSVLFLLFSCQGNKGESVPMETAGITVSSTLEIHDRVSLNSYDADSPAMTIDISLPRVVLDNEKATQKMEKAIAAEIFRTDKTVPDACAEFCDESKKTYSHYKDEYINLTNEGKAQAEHLNHFYNISAYAEQGLGNCINYIVTWNEFCGGAHGNTYNNVINIDKSNGNVIMLSDIMKEGYEKPLTELLTKKFIEHTGSKNIDDTHEKGEFYHNTDLFISSIYIIGKENITFIYNRYDIAPDIAKEIKLTTDYKELKELLK